MPCLEEKDETVVASRLPQSTCPITGNVSDHTINLCLREMRLQRPLLPKNSCPADPYPVVQRESDVIPGMLPESPYEGP
jgi:hypothetical protein